MDSVSTTAMPIPRTFTSIASPIWRNSSTTPDERRTAHHRNFAQAASCVPGARLADSTRATWTVSRAGDGRWGAARGAPRCGGDDGIRGRTGNGMPAAQLERHAGTAPPGGWHARICVHRQRSRQNALQRDGGASGAAAREAGACGASASGAGGPRLETFRPAREINYLYAWTGSLGTAFDFAASGVEQARPRA